MRSAQTRGRAEGWCDRQAPAPKELTDLILKCPAHKQVIILDTCASGRLVGKLTEKREFSWSQIRAYDRMKDRTGMFVLAGCASDRVSYQFTRFGQGVLTYSLLQGMQGPGLKDKQYVDVSTLFQYSRDQVPKAAGDIGGIQQPVLVAPKDASSFDIGLLKDEDRARIPVAKLRPVFLRPSFELETEPADPLGLTRKLEELFADASARGRDAKLMFWGDVNDYAGAYALRGRYRVEADTVTVTCYMQLGTEKLGPFIVKGTKSGVDDLAKAIIAEAEQRSAARP